MITNVCRREKRAVRRRRVRQKIRGTPDRPRLSVMVSNRHIYAQFIDDTKGATVVSVSTLDLENKPRVTVATAAEIGKRAVAAAKQKGITKVVFDRAGFKFHGRVKAIAEAVRAAGLLGPIAVKGREDGAE